MLKGYYITAICDTSSELLPRQLKAIIRAMELRFAEEYAVKSNNELIRLWFDRDSLLPEARDALEIEIRNRQLDIKRESEKLAALDRAAKHREWRRRANAVKEGNQQGGYGRIGRTNCTFNSNAGHEEFDSTVFLFVAHFPLIPIRAYRIQRSPKTERERILREVPITWSNVREIWAKSAFVAAAIFLALTLLWKYWLYYKLHSNS